jgi:hypothetical protein
VVTYIIYVAKSTWNIFFNINPLTTTFIFTKYQSVFVKMQNGSYP